MKPKPSQDIRRHIARLQEGVMFTTKDVLHCARRNTVDQALSRLCKKDVIGRIARGVYVKLPRRPIPLPTPQEVAQVKAQSWGKRIMESGQDAAFKLELTEEAEQALVFLTTGCTTAFNSVVGRIRFRKAAPKKVLLGDSNMATKVKAFWHMGKWFCRQTDCLRQVFEPVWQNAPEREELITFAAIMPSWLRDMLMLERYFNALHWERMKRAPIDLLTKTTQYLPGALRDESALALADP